MKNGHNKKTEGPERSRRIVVAMSGGVDSSVAAVLLKKAGVDVVGIFMKFWSPSYDTKNEKLARLVAKKIGIPFYVLNVEREFKNKVVDYFLKEYKAGKTPNPCVGCNKEIKFGFLIDKALKMGANFVATGHYAKISFGNKFFSARDPLFQGSQPSHSKNLLPRLFKGKDKKKDQSYFLWQLNQKQIKHILFPVGNYTKPQVRALAKKFKLPVAETPESQEICFAQNTTNDFLRKYLKTNPGDICLTSEVKQRIIGQHNGLWFYTIGQRKGIGINQGPYYVAGKDFGKNILVVSKDKKDLFKKELIAKNVNWISGKQAKLPLKVKAKIRYKSNLAKAKILAYKRNQVRIIFERPQMAITPGQSVVFYRGDELLGGGVIK